MSSHKFRAEITDIKMVYNVLKAIAFKEFAIIHPMKEGLKITIEEMKCVETSAYLSAEMFSSYHVDPTDDLKFKISLKALTECLHIYGDDGNPSLKLSYKALGSPLSLVIKHNEENITVDCEIQTMDADEFNDLSLADECTNNKVVVNAGPFVDVLMDLDQMSDDFELLLGPEPPYFRITTSSVTGTSVIDISKHYDMVTLFQCDKTCKYEYAFSYIKQILKVMSYASKVLISTGDTGLLGFQLVVNGFENQMHVEYYVTSLFGND